MYAQAESVNVGTDEGRFVLEIESEHGDMYYFRLDGIDLDAFYDQVKGRIGPYLQEMHSARAAFVCAPTDVDESGGYAPDDPKSPGWHSIHADIYDSRAGK